MIQWCDGRADRDLQSPATPSKGVVLAGTLVAFRDLRLLGRRPRRASAEQQSAGRGRRNRAAIGSQPRNAERTMCRVPLAEPVKPNEAYSAIEATHRKRREPRRLVGPSRREMTWVASGLHHRDAHPGIAQPLNRSPRQQPRCQHAADRVPRQPSRSPRCRSPDPKSRPRTPPPGRQSGLPTRARPRR